MASRSQIDLHRHGIDAEHAALEKENDATRASIALLIREYNLGVEELTKLDQVREALDRDMAISIADFELLQDYQRQYQRTAAEISMHRDKLDNYSLRRAWSVHSNMKRLLTWVCLMVVLVTFIALTALASIVIAGGITPSPRSLAPLTPTPSQLSYAEGTRDPLTHPFHSHSIWNHPIGSGARFVSAQLAPSQQYGLYAEEEIIILTPSAPLTAVYENHSDWHKEQIVTRLMVRC